MYTYFVYILLLLLGQRDLLQAKHHPDSRQGGTCGLRFSNAEEKDERTLAYEKLAEEWNRNLILGQRQCRQYDYEEESVNE